MNDAVDSRARRRRPDPGPLHARLDLRDVLLEQDPRPPRHRGALPRPGGASSSASRSRFRRASSALRFFSAAALASRSFFCFASSSVAFASCSARCCSRAPPLPASRCFFISSSFCSSASRSRRNCSACSWSSRRCRSRRRSSSSSFCISLRRPRIRPPRSPRARAAVSASASAAGSETDRKQPDHRRMQYRGECKRPRMLADESRHDQRSSDLLTDRLLERIGDESDLLGAGPLQQHHGRHDAAIGHGFVRLHEHRRLRDRAAGPPPLAPGRRLVHRHDPRRGRCSGTCCPLVDAQHQRLVLFEHVGIERFRTRIRQVHLDALRRAAAR